MLIRWVIDHSSAIDVVWLCRALWIAGILPIAIASIPSSKLDALHRFVLSLSRRGKIMESSSKKLSVPQKFFCHFYVVGVLWNTFLLVSVSIYAYETSPILSEPVLVSSVASHLTGTSHELSLNKSRASLNYKYGLWKSVFLLLLMEAQVLRRLFESMYVFKYSPAARMHIAGYFTGLIFYTAAPLSICCMYSLDVFKFVANMFAELVLIGKDTVIFTGFGLWGFVGPLMQFKWYVWMGAVLFSWGWIHQFRCHAILGSLRESDKNTNNYAIPRGDWFEYVSSPHYLAEIVIYGGLVIASGFSDITMWLLFGFVVANLAFAAAETQRWYLAKFDDYPRNRYAIIPLVY